MKIGVIIGSTRRGRKGDQVGHWIAQHISTAGVSAEIVDLADMLLPLYDSETYPAAANGTYADPIAQAWSDAITAYDAYIFVTPEYNHSVSAPMKNAFDTLYSEWMHKPVAFASYGAAGGVRAVEHWRAIVSNAYMFDARAQLALFLDSDFTGDLFTPKDAHQHSLNRMIAEVVILGEAATALKSAAVA